jgi:hypothetical protein
MKFLAELQFFELYMKFLNFVFHMKHELREQLYWVVCKRVGKERQG